MPDIVRPVIYFVKLPDTTTTREFDIPTTYSRLVTKDWSVFFTETFRVIEDASRGTRSGFDNFVIGTQYQLYTNPEHQFVVTVGGTAAIGGGKCPLCAARTGRSGEVSFLTRCMVRPRVARGSSTWQMRSCINVSGL
jgi:hypothetical protein